MITGVRLAVGLLTILVGGVLTGVLAAVVTVRVGVALAAVAAVTGVAATTGLALALMLDGTT